MKSKEEHFRVPLVEKIDNYIDKGITYFDVPGHKKNPECRYLTDFFGDKVVLMDTNSSKEVDNLSTPKGPIKSANELMADAYGADHAFLLINGSTVGVQTMIMSVCKPHDKIILPRNVHKSVINALILVGAIPVYIKPEIDERLGIVTGVRYDEVKKTIEENLDAKAILLLNPTYYGITVNIKAIVELAHSHGMAALVDEAHGAHFAFHNDLPIHAMDADADIAVSSMHKAGGSLTQSAVLMMKEGIVKYEKVRLILNLLHTTSASYILMTSLDLARRNLVTNGEEIFTRVLELAKKARDLIDKIPNMFTFSKGMINGDNVYDFDETKLVVNVYNTGHTGFEVYDMLYELFKIQVEVADANNIMAVLSVGDTEENILKLVDALVQISKKSKKVDGTPFRMEYIEPEVCASPRDAYFGESDRVLFKDSVDKISTESVMVYPPGIPIISPGERITSETIEYIEFIKKQECAITDLADTNIEYIHVLKE